LTDRLPLKVGFDARTGWWVVEPLAAIGADLHECDLVSVRVTVGDGGGAVELDILAPDVANLLRLYFVATGIEFDAPELSSDVPRSVYGQISGTDYAAPNWYSLQALRCNLEVYSDSQYFEWIKGR
jgi:hypothetical protein